MSTPPPPGVGRRIVERGLTAYSILVSRFGNDGTASATAMTTLLFYSVWCTAPSPASPFSASQIEAPLTTAALSPTALIGVALAEAHMAGGADGASIDVGGRGGALGIATGCPTTASCAD